MSVGQRWMDICTGTGEMGTYLSRLAGKKTMVVAAGASAPMIHEAIAKPEARQVAFVIADATALPFRYGTFDLVAFSFATRNINVSPDALIRCFRESYGILEPEWRFVNLETTRPSSRLVRRLFHLYTRLAVRALGYIISASKSGYAYLSDTIRRFHNAEELADITRQARFARVDFHRVPFGIAAIH